MATVLIVEDDPWLADCYSRWLADYTVTIANSAQAALDALDNGIPQLILLDLFLPTVNGIQLLNELRSYSDLADIPVVVCSNAAPKNINLAAYGVKTVLDKAELTPEKLKSVISEVINHANA